MWSSLGQAAFVKALAEAIQDVVVRRRLIKLEDQDPAEALLHAIGHPLK